MIRFGKSSGPLLAHKRGFFEQNGALLDDTRRIGSVYRRQPRRTACKCCAGPLGSPLFTKQAIAYTACERCGHLNGAHEDSGEFCATVYVEDGGTDYARTYSAADREAYAARVRDIYRPKAEFLGDALCALGEAPAALRYADFGAGSGYFVTAMRELGWHDARGFEVSEVQAALADAMLGEGGVVRHALADAVGLARTTDADVATMIGVLEHVQAPRAVLAALRDNPQVRYLFLSVPLFSPCVFFEMAFPEVFPRQLSAGHTHLFTERSLDWCCAEFGMERVAEWWFGTDIVDLFRAVTVELERHPELSGAATAWAAMFAPAIDDLQRALDERRLASEVHMLLRFTT